MGTYSQTEWQKKYPWPEHLFNGKNVVGKKELPAKDTPEWKKLYDRNQALAEPRNDARFKDINTMHPRYSGKFPDSGMQKQKKRK